MGNVLKDVYLNLDTRTEKFETDAAGNGWLDFCFNASEHHFFNRGSSFGGAAISLEVFKKMGLDASIADHSASYIDDELQANDPAEVYRYIKVSDNGVSYLVPSNFRTSSFDTPDMPYDYVYIDRSAELNDEIAHRISDYLDVAKHTKLIVYLRDAEPRPVARLAQRADLVFLEERDTAGPTRLLDATRVSAAEKTQAPETLHFSPEKIVHLSERKISYLKIAERLSPRHVDRMTHLSMFSIASATVVACFLLGKSVEDSLKMARLNVENSRLDSVLSLEELKNLMVKNDSDSDIELIAANLMLAGKGILAADESGGNIHKKFEQMGIDDNYNNRRDYRNMLFTAPELEKYVNGVILFDETARQYADDGRNFVEFLTSKRIIPGIKVDQGLAQFDNSTETYTNGLEGLEMRLEEYYNMGLRFAKWRAAFKIHFDKDGNLITPSGMAIQENCHLLAQYAKACQVAGLVPIVEPEVVYDGNYDIDQSSFVTSRVLDCLFENLEEAKINLRGCILKVNMVMAGKKWPHQSTPEEVGLATSKVLRSHVPESLAGVVFLSGGQTPEQATDNLAAIYHNGPFPWPVTFSFARALQGPALEAWAGDNQNSEKARQAFLDRLIANTDSIK